MTKIETTKSVVNIMTSLTAGAVIGNTINANRNHSDNAALELTLSASALVTGFVVGRMARKKLQAESDAMIEAAASWYHQNVTNSPKK